MTTPAPATLAALQAARLFITGEAMPTKDEVLALIDAAMPTLRTVSQLQKARVTAIRECNAYLGHATGVLLAGNIECIVITATREDAQAFMDQNSTTPGDARFSTPVAMVQRKDVVIIEPEDTP